MFTRIHHIILPVAASLCIALSLSSCGIKPDSVEPPPGAESKEFPRTYPDPSTDPKPL
ncbi:MAG: hypothetical protein H6867_10055 [Rhodospirillales bacterium]|nr:hypothetical protein [Rhodospirillales bacterium]MCB9995873.1 hypothetical protein [Rhodospirillales bacterium]